MKNQEKKIRLFLACVFVGIVIAIGSIFLIMLVFGWHFVSSEEYQKLIANQSRPDLNISADRKTELVFYDGAPNVPLGYCYSTPKEKEMFSWPPPQEDIDSVLNGHWECQEKEVTMEYRQTHFENCVLKDYNLVSDSFQCDAYSCDKYIWVKDGD